MGANSFDNRAVILSKLVEIEQHLKGWEIQCTNTDCSYHFAEIRSHFGRAKYHIGQIPNTEDVEKVVEKKNSIEEVKKGEKIMEIPADNVKAKVDQVKLNVTFRDKKIRKAPSWKYLEKWMSILDEEYKDREDEYQGVNIIVPKRIQQFGGNNNKKCNSTECILDDDTNTSATTFDSSNKRFISEGNLLDNFEYKGVKRDSMGNIFSQNNYLLSLRDLQSFDRLNNLVDNTSTDSDESEDYDAHKPRIVGVIEKKKL